MDERIDIWNLLHDGEISALSEEGDVLTMFVSIPFIRRRLRPLGDSFVLTLSGVRKAELRDFSGEVSTLREEIETGTPDILESGSKAMPVIIETTMGQLTLDFQGIRFALDTGQPTEFETIQRTCNEYWTELQARSERRRSPCQRSEADNWQSDRPCL
ncbi:MAG: hypothetical protein BroJett014_19370 [Planctomycetota bacterium]|nr:hypothetical protein [Planctomycetota bacterium]GIK52964.1 MAG: hypothetical protein BroJett014_19370 [Planctomycetota bacterium]